MSVRLPNTTQRGLERAMLERILEPEVMDSEAEAHDYDAMDHREVNSRFASDFLTFADALPLVSTQARMQLLDVGCGTGQIPLELVRRRPFQITAIDLAEHMLALGRRNVAAAGVADAITFNRVDARRLPYADGQFDAVISNSIVHHIPAPLEVLREMQRVVRPGGVLFVRDLLRPHDRTTLDRLVGLYVEDGTPLQRKLFRDSLHAALTLEEMRELVRQLELSESAVAVTSDRHWTLAVRIDR
jgi:ubiquinone/menaquinone biosynthesis C-methylase UbiE